MKYYLLTLLTAVLFYFGSLKLGFSQDDFYFLLISSADNLTEVLSFFSPWHQQGFPFYRPLGTQLYFWVFQQQAFYMHLFMLLLHAGSGLLVYQLAKKLVKDSRLALMVGVSYTAAAAHFLSLYYIAATQQLFSAFFAFLSLNLFVRKKPKAAAFALAFGLLSKESAIVVPAIAFLLYFFHLKGSLKLPKLLSAFSPYLLCTIFYLLLRFSGGLTVQSEYHPVIGFSLISSLRWYYLFTFNAPEVLLNYSGIQLFVNYWRFVHDLGLAALINALSSLLLAFTTLFILIRSLIKNSPLTRFQILMYFQWWLLGIFLIIWFPDHRYPHYLDLSLPALLIPLYFGLKKFWRYLAFILFLVGAYTGLELSVTTHWTVGRAKMTDSALTYFQTHNLCQHDSLYFVGDPAARELSYTLSLENGPQVICQKPSLEVYYQGVTEIPLNPTVTIDAKELVN